MTKTGPLPPLDANGTSVAVGDRVEIVTIPHWLTHDLPPEDQSRLKAFEKQVVVIAEIDKFGYLWFLPPAAGFSLRPVEVRREKAKERWRTVISAAWYVQIAVLLLAIVVAFCQRQ